MGASPEEAIRLGLGWPGGGTCMRSRRPTWVGVRPLVQFDAHPLAVLAALVVLLAVGQAHQPHLTQAALVEQALGQDLLGKKGARSGGPGELAPGAGACRTSWSISCVASRGG